ncbi:MurR/RpiR family transcriptional regulator [Oceanobacillus alkalisoli]|uniref:MurR/RpiR family transcriptional regulator n=1 Tax=Oceanobacillus alkalisoli TaxID=2925113 RepID=UPI001F11ED89|nr:MurR/RpiR family transcriptional regulator [Oceanobacillus alkalisoli]MCF3944531.1 MurR/RpiR family transcriptional regulator [Oceanobacillus alkalisoli]
MKINLHSPSMNRIIIEENGERLVTDMALFLNVDKTQLPTKQQQVMEVIEKRGIKVAYLSIDELAEEAGVSTATISRFFPLAGFENFKQFKEYVKKRIETTPENKLRNSILDIGGGDTLDRMIEQNYEYLFQTHTHLNRKDLLQAVTEVIHAKRVIIHAPSSSEGLGTLLSHRLKRFGILVERTARSGADIFESMIHFDEKDVIIIFQYVKLLPESKAILDYANRLGIKTILFTDQLVGEMNRLADYVLYAYRGDTWEFHSMVAATTVVEMLVMLVGQRLEEKSMENLQKLSKLRREYGDIVPS